MWKRGHINNIIALNCEVFFVLLRIINFAVIAVRLSMTDVTIIEWNTSHMSCNRQNHFVIITTMPDLKKFSPFFLLSLNRFQNKRLTFSYVWNCEIFTASVWLRCSTYNKKIGILSGYKGGSYILCLSCFFKMHSLRF